jgi:hypothetical protein
MYLDLDEQLEELLGTSKDFSASEDISKTDD